jgi:hypothetical protein
VLTFLAKNALFLPIIDLYIEISAKEPNEESKKHVCFAKNFLVKMVTCGKGKKQKRVLMSDFWAFYPDVQGD